MWQVPRLQVLGPVGTVHATSHGVGRRGTRPKLGFCRRNSDLEETRGSAPGVPSSRITALLE